MGGVGSGRKQSNRMTSELYRLNVRSCERAGRLHEGIRSWFLLAREGGADVNTWTRFQGRTLAVEINLGRDLFGERQVRFSVPVVFEAMPFGGRRPWFLCPGASCGRRAVILYGLDREYRCRFCRHVTYPLQRVVPHHRALARAQLLRMRLGAGPDISAPLPPRPKGMHEWTYTRKSLAILNAERKANEAMLKLFEHIPRRARCADAERPEKLDWLFSDDPNVEIPMD